MKFYVFLFFLAVCQQVKGSQAKDFLNDMPVLSDPDEFRTYASRKKNPTWRDLGEGLLKELRDLRSDLQMKKTSLTPSIDDLENSPLKFFKDVIYNLNILENRLDECFSHIKLRFLPRLSRLGIFWNKFFEAFFEGQPSLEGAQGDSRQILVRSFHYFSHLEDKDVASQGDVMASSTFLREVPLGVVSQQEPSMVSPGLLHPGSLDGHTTGISSASGENEDEDVASQGDVMASSTLLREGTLSAVSHQKPSIEFHGFLDQNGLGSSNHRTTGISSASGENRDRIKGKVGGAGKKPQPSSKIFHSAAVVTVCACVFLAAKYLKLERKNKNPENIHLEP